MTTLAPGDARSRLEMAVELLRREWREGCPAGMAYQTALGSVRRLRSVAVSDQIAADLSRVINDLEAYPSLLPEYRPVALTEISAAIKRLIPKIAKLEWTSSPVRSVLTLEQEPTPVIVSEDQSTQIQLSGVRPSPATILDTLLALSPSEFEHAVARLLPHLGYRDVRRTGGAGDLGADIVCYDEHDGFVIVQCKRYAPGNNVTSPNIQQFFGMMVHHGARQGIYVTTSSFTKSALDLAAARDIRTMDGEELLALFGTHPDVLGIAPFGFTHHGSMQPAVHENRPETRYPDPSEPVVLPDFYSDRPEHAARTARHAWLAQLHPETPVIAGYRSQWVSGLTEEEKRAWTRIRERLLAVTPEQFRKACVLSHVALWEKRDEREIRLLENENASIKDYVITSRSQHSQPSISRCHHLPAEQAVSAEQLGHFVRFAKANGWSAGPYSTTGLFSAGALLRTDDCDLGATLDGWHVAFWLHPDIHLPTKGKDFIALALQPGWPKMAKVSEGTERRGVLRRLFG